MAPLRRILGQHKPPEPGTYRMRDDEILQTLKVPPLEAQHGGLFCWNGMAGGIGASTRTSLRVFPDLVFRTTFLGGVLEPVAWTRGYVDEDFSGKNGS